MWISPVFAASSNPPSLDTLSFIPSLLLALLVFLFMGYFPKKKAREHRMMLEKLQKGDEVLMTSGLLGKVAHVGEAYITLEISVGMEAQFQRQAISRILPKGSIKAAA